MSWQTEQDRLIDAGDPHLITRRQAIERVTALLGGIALVGGGALLTGCRPDRAADPRTTSVAFSAEEIAFLDEIAETILPETSTPGAKAAAVGPFMAHMVVATYDEPDQRIFRDGIRQVDDESRAMHGVGFMEATPEQRLALLERLDREQKAQMDAREEARRARDATDDHEGDRPAEGDEYLPDQRQEAVPGAEAAGAAAITADTPAHYFRMMKELALLGYFTSEIGYTQAMRYVESPGRFDPCAPYTPGEPAWAPHA
jgi:hypothetical protein